MLGSTGRAVMAADTTSDAQRSAGTRRVALKTAWVRCRHSNILPGDQCRLTKGVLETGGRSDGRKPVLRALRTAVDQRRRPQMTAAPPESDLDRDHGGRLASAGRRGSSVTKRCTSVVNRSVAVSIAACPGRVRRRRGRRAGPRLRSALSCGRRPRSRLRRQQRRHSQAAEPRRIDGRNCSTRSRASWTRPAEAGDAAGLAWTGLASATLYREL
jgi:hypothetical protein